MKNVHIKLRFIDPVLGMSPSNPDIYMDFIASKAPQGADTSDELPPEDGMDPKGVTVFPRTPDGVPCFFDYQIKGMFKDACSLLAKTTGKDENGKKSKKKAVTLSGGVSAYKKLIDGNIFVSPRMIPIQFDGPVTLCQRPLRAMTMRGERVSLACAEEIPAGAAMEFDVKLYNDDNVLLLAEWMAYGEDHGMGQWRNSGKGRFCVEQFEVSDAEALKPKFDITYV